MTIVERQEDVVERAVNQAKGDDNPKVGPLVPHGVAERLFNEHGAVDALAVAHVEALPVERVDDAAT